MAKAAMVPSSCVLPSWRATTGIRFGRPDRTGKGGASRVLLGTLQLRSSRWLRSS
jgi:hypothetical protein